MIKKSFVTSKDLISLNSEVLNEASIEELEERLELGSWGCADDCGSPYNDMYCEYPYDMPPPTE